MFIVETMSLLFDHVHETNFMSATPALGVRMGRVKYDLTDGFRVHMGNVRTLRRSPLVFGVYRYRTCRGICPSI